MRESLKTTGLFCLIVFVVFFIGGGLIEFFNFEGPDSERIFASLLVAIPASVLGILCLGSIFFVVALLDSIRYKRRK